LDETGVTRLWPALEIQLPVNPNPHLVELLLARLDDFQPTAIHEPEHGPWRVFFAGACARDDAGRAVASEFWARGIVSWPVDVDDEDWAVRSQARLRAVIVGRLVVAPPWDIPEHLWPGSTLIVIEPSVGFGTGHHASTRLCLEALQKLDVSGWRVLDLGTGSGVLAVAAVLLGARHVLAVDRDADALDSARQSARRNKTDTLTSFEHADFRQATLPQAELVMANLTGAILSGALARVIELAEPGGALILSGFTSEEPVARRDGPIATSPLVQIIDQLDDEGWRCLVLRRRVREG
jgi:ribosomal protein L11 methyltransferase